MHSRMHFNFVKCLDTTPGSIFYSLIKYQDAAGSKILAACRHNYAYHQIKIVLLNNDLDIVMDDEKLIVNGEDPRCFYHNDDLYIQDNYWNDVHLINFSKNTLHQPKRKMRQTYLFLYILKLCFR